MRAVGDGNGQTSEVAAGEEKKEVKDELRGVTTVEC